MSRLPTLSTPGRFTTPPPTTGIPTPSHRRPRSSLGPAHAPVSHSTPDEAMSQLQEALRNRPAAGSMKSRDPSGGSSLGDNDPDTPTQPPSSSSSTLGVGGTLAAPRTPGIRSRTPSSVGIGHAPTTPSAVRPPSRLSVGGRPSLAASTGHGVFTPRRPSMASSTTSTTPFAKRPESRASTAHEHTAKFIPVVGDRVRAQSVGMEGTLRFMGTTEFKAGVWAGVELSGGFEGKGKNNGSVDGFEYFSCPPNCGIFVLATKLSAPTSGPSRPASVASSHRSLASSHASYSLGGRATPSANGPTTPAFDRVRPATTTPGRATRTVSSSVRGMSGKLMESDESSPLDQLNRPTRITLGNSTSSNAVLPEGRITAGSRASKYVGMTAKQLDHARGTNGGIAVTNRNLLSGSTTTPKASRISMGGLTPARTAGRQSMGGGMTPKPRARMSTAMEMMPPPPSPSNVARLVAQTQHTSSLEEEIRELKKKNQELEDELNNAHPSEEERTRLEELKSEVEKVKEEADSLRYQLSASQADANDATKMAEEMSESQKLMTEELEVRVKELGDLKKELKVTEERMKGELEAGMEARRAEVRRMEARAEAAEVECADMRGLVEELTQAGQATIALYERKLNDSQNKQYDLEAQLRTLETQIQKLKDEAASTSTPASPGTAARTAISAAEIDNENLQAQLKHLQNKLDHLEEEMEEVRAQAETDGEAWKARLAKAKDAEMKGREEIKRLKGEIEGLMSNAQGAKGRIGELEGALQENQAALEGTRAEIEVLRVEAAEANAMRAALQTATVNEKALAATQEEVADLKAKLEKAEKAELRVAELEDKVASLEAEATSLKRSTPEPTSMLEPNKLLISISPSPDQPHRPLPDRRLSYSSDQSYQGSVGGTPRAPKARLSTGSSTDKSLRGFQHIIQELTGDNQVLKDRVAELEEEVGLLKEEIKLLEETAEPGMGGENASKELVEVKAELSVHVQTIKELNREVAELESLIESKIYREDELETRAQALEKDLESWRKKAMALSANSGQPLSALSISTHSRTTSVSTIGTGDESEDGAGDRCELCEGPHQLDACPVFAGNVSLGTEEFGEKISPSAGRGVGGGFGAVNGNGLKKSGKWCADCESTAHDTADCPMAEEVF